MRGADEGPQPRPVPGLRPFLRSRFISLNGLLSALYLLLSIWVMFHPERAARLWRRLQGQQGDRRGRSAPRQQG